MKGRYESLKETDITKKSQRSYFLQSWTLLIYAIMMCSIYSDTKSKQYSPDWLNALIAGCAIMIGASLFAIVFYCCKLNPLLKFMVAGTIISGGVIYFGAYVKKVDEYYDDYARNTALKISLMAEPVLTLLICIIIGVQVLTDVIVTEDRRISAQCGALVIFCLLLLPYYYDRERNKLTDGQQAIESGGTVLWVVCLFTIVVFLVFYSMASFLVRLILICGILGGSIVLVGGYSTTVDEICGGKHSPNYCDATFKANMVSAGILALLESLVICIDVLF